MFCPKCGKEIEDDAVVCIHCGRAVAIDKKYSPEFNKSKAGVGVALGLFLGLIGLVIGLLIYPQDTVARNTFIKAWGVSFAITMAIALLFLIFTSRWVRIYI